LQIFGQFEHFRGCRAKSTVFIPVPVENRVGDRHQRSGEHFLQSQLSGCNQHLTSM